MKTVELVKGVKETNKNYLVELDIYTKRDSYYSGSLFGQVLAIEKSVYPELLKEGFNYYYNTELDVIISKFRDGIEINGVKLFRKGQKVQ